MTTICKQEYSTKGWFGADSEDPESEHQTFQSENIGVKVELEDLESEESEFECSNSSQPSVEGDFSPCTAATSSLCNIETPLPSSTKQYPQSQPHSPGNDKLISRYRSSQKSFQYLKSKNIGVKVEPVDCESEESEFENSNSSQPPGEGNFWLFTRETSLPYSIKKYQESPPNSPGNDNLFSRYLPSLKSFQDGFPFTEETSLPFSIKQYQQIPSYSPGNDNLFSRYQAPQQSFQDVFLSFTEETSLPYSIKQCPQSPPNSPGNDNHFSRHQPPQKSFQDVFLSFSEETSLPYSIKQFPQSPPCSSGNDSLFLRHQPPHKSSHDVSHEVIDLSSGPEPLETPSPGRVRPSPSSLVKKKRESLDSLTDAQKYSLFRKQNKDAVERFRENRKEKIKLLDKEEAELSENFSPFTKETSLPFSIKQYQESPPNSLGNDNLFSRYQPPKKSFQDVSHEAIDLSSAPESPVSPPSGELSPASLVSKKKMSLKSLTDTQKYFRIRKQNNDASKKCRKKQREKNKLLAKEMVELSELNIILKDQQNSMKKTVKFMRSILDQIWNTPRPI